MNNFHIFATFPVNFEDCLMLNVAYTIFKIISVFFIWQSSFQEMIRRRRTLHTEPKFYHIITENNLNLDWLLKLPSETLSVLKKLHPWDIEENIPIRLFSHVCGRVKSFFFYFSYSFVLYYKRYQHVHSTLLWKIG